jgi:hypothetical protein
VPVTLVDGRAQDAVAASDAVLVASGTATLETALVKRPMVVAYRVAPLTGWLLRSLKLVKTEWFSQPNLLAGRTLVPEYFQEQVRPEVLGPAVIAQLERPDQDALTQAFNKGIGGHERSLLPRRTWRLMVRVVSTGSMGLTITPSIPACKQRSQSSGWVLAVRPSKGICDTSARD